MAKLLTKFGLVIILFISIVTLAVSYIFYRKGEATTYTKYIPPNYENSSVIPRQTEPAKVVVNTVNADEVFKLTNVERSHWGLKDLKRNPKLDAAAALRVKNIFEFQEWSHTAPKSGVTYTKAMGEVNYVNNNEGENLANGFLTSQDIVLAWMGSTKGHRENILGKQWQEMGVAMAPGTLLGQDTVLVVQLFGGYTPPDYKKEFIDSWKNTLNDLKNIQPGWVKLKDDSAFYDAHRQDVDRINEIISFRISNLEDVVKTIEANKWLSKQQNDYLNNTEPKLNEEERLAANRLNSK